MLEDTLNVNGSLDPATSSESDMDMDFVSMRHDALAWMESIIGTCKSEYQCKFYAQQYARIYNKVTG